MTAIANLKRELSSKKNILPEDGPVSGLVVAWSKDKHGHPKTLRIETVRGTFQAKLNKELRQPLSAELSPGMAVRLWVKVKSQTVKALLVVPLEAKQVLKAGVPPGASGAAAVGKPQACIWVCTSKSCCRKGGSELLESVKLAAESCEAQIEVKKCGCLGTCKKGPSLKIRGDKKVHQVSPCAVPQWLNKALATRN